jgi:LPXTG-motif cell wall-anchored protein
VSYVTPVSSVQASGNAMSPSTLADTGSDLLGALGAALLALLAGLGALLFTRRRAAKA